MTSLGRLDAEASEHRVVQTQRAVRRGEFRIERDGMVQEFLHPLMTTGLDH